MLVGLISDTHGRVHGDVHRHFAGVEAILHAGDVGGEDVLEELRLITPHVHAVAGNVDCGEADLPLKRVVELPLGKVGLSHGHLDPSDQGARVRSLCATFAPNGVRLILHGHSHQQFLEFRKSTWIINPGAACPPRFSTVATVCLLHWDMETDLLSFHFKPLNWKQTLR